MALAESAENGGPSLGQHSCRHRVAGKDKFLFLLLLPDYAELFKIDFFPISGKATSV